MVAVVLAEVVLVVVAAIVVGVTAVVAPVAAARSSLKKGRAARARGEARGGGGGKSRDGCRGSVLVDVLAEAAEEDGAAVALARLAPLPEVGRHLAQGLERGGRRMHEFCIACADLEGLGTP